MNSDIPSRSTDKIFFLKESGSCSLNCFICKTRESCVTTTPSKLCSDGQLQAINLSKVRNRLTLLTTSIILATSGSGGVWPCTPLLLLTAESELVAAISLCAAGGAGRWKISITRNKTSNRANSEIIPRL